MTLKVNTATGTVAGCSAFSLVTGGLFVFRGFTVSGCDTWFNSGLCRNYWM